MAITIDKSDRYWIRGKIVHISGSALTISVISPFTCEIKFDCRPAHYNILHPPVFSEYNWMDLQGAHPGVTEAAAYYNTKDKCFYKKESGRGSEWKSTDFEDIYDDNEDIYNDNPALVTKNQIITQQEK